jgi:sporulation-control protein spo0M
VDPTVDVEGGATMREVVLETEYVSDDGSHEPVEIARTGTAEGAAVEPDEQRTFPATMTVPRVTLLTKGAVSVPLVTVLEIEGEEARRDRGAVEVVGTEPMQAALTAVERLGFVFSGSTCRDASAAGPVPYVQAFEFEPASAERRPG